MATEKAKAAAKRKKQLLAGARTAEKLAAEVKAALEEAGYEFPEFKEPEERARFVYEKGYIPATLLLDAIQVAEFNPNWKKSIVPAPGQQVKA